MKFSKYILGAGALLCLLSTTLPAAAQSLRLKCLQWNIKSFEYDDNSNAVHFSVDETVEKIKLENPDVVIFNEFETASGRMASKEKLTECAQQLGMFPYVGFSYDKDNGVYGNGILSKYPIVNSGSKLLGKHGGADQRSVGWADVLVPTDAKPEGVKVRLVATHLDPFGNSTTILNQAKEVIAYAIQPALDLNIPVILMGDMNTGWTDAAILEYLTIGARLCDNTGTFGGSKLDYFIAFPKNKWSCNDYVVRKGGRYEIMSDHYPIVGTAVLQN